MHFSQVTGIFIGVWDNWNLEHELELIINYLTEITSMMGTQTLKGIPMM